MIICTANKFRSPIAASLLQRKIDLMPDSKDWHIQSAGTWTAEGQPAPSITIQIGKRLGLAAIEEHRTRQVNFSLLDDANLIIVMEASQKEALTSEFPSIRGKAFLLAEIVDDKLYDIPDPAYPLVDADEVADEINHLINVGSDKILSKAKYLFKPTDSNLLGNLKQQTDKK
jgi:protein-tyrosine phosphatase